MFGMVLQETNRKTHIHAGAPGFFKTCPNHRNQQELQFNVAKCLSGFGPMCIFYCVNMFCWPTSFEVAIDVQLLNWVPHSNSYCGRLRTPFLNDSWIYLEESNHSVGFLNGAKWTHFLSGCSKKNKTPNFLFTTKVVFPTSLCIQMISVDQKTMK